ncbi:MAG TPA: cytochrome c oxidase assembly protein [Acidimicrobiales bacterium]|nr:cytochrome c oxidase assembly protein [Acidimicrobiales bacterium]
MQTLPDPSSRGGGPLRYGSRAPPSPAPSSLVRWWLGAGVAVVAVALSPPVDARADATLAAHMAQHVVLTMVGAPLLAAGLPRIPGIHPVVAWLLFAATGWLVHFTPLYETATESLPVHVFEHALLLGTALLFWAQVVGPPPRSQGRSGPGPRLSHPMRLLYLIVAMPQNTFLALAISSSGRVLYDHYAGGRDPLGDQRLAGGIMWVAGDLVLLVAVLLVAAAWARHEERETRLREEAADRLPSPRTAG